LNTAKQKKDSTMFKYALQLATVAFLVFFAASNVPPATSKSSNGQQPEAKGGEAIAFTVSGRAQCAPGKKATIAPVPLHPVVEVRIAPGDRVKKEQKLIKLDDDEPQADVRNKLAILEAARVCQKEATRYYKRLEENYKHAAISEASFFSAMRDALKAVHDEKAAEAAVESAKAELEHYEVEAQIDGIVSWLDVYPGMVSRPGTTVWGEILDLSEIDIRCDITLDQAEKVKKGQNVEVVRQTQKNGAAFAGKVSMLGITVDAKTGLVPVLVRVANPDMVLRCGEPVQLRFAAEAKE
jgi:RND family efflux transporter MFP subunit